VNGSFWCGLLSNAYARAGDFEQALDALDEAFARIEAHQERWWEPELHRQLGELALCAQQQASPRTRARFAARAAPEAAFERARELACRLGAKSLELRAATSLARQWAATHRARAARELLGGVFGGFREGFDTFDLKRASELLITLDAS
jgi:predicted ATPase